MKHSQLNLFSCNILENESEQGEAITLDKTVSKKWRLQKTNNFFNLRFKISRSIFHEIAVVRSITHTRFQHKLHSDKNTGRLGTLLGTQFFDEMAFKMQKLLTTCVSEKGPDNRESKKPTFSTLSKN